VSGRELGRESKGCRRCQEWKRNRLRNYCMAKVVRYAHSFLCIRSWDGSWWIKVACVVLWERWRWRWSILENRDLSRLSKRTVRFSPLSHSFPPYLYWHAISIVHHRLVSTSKVSSIYPEVMHQTIECCIPTFRKLLSISLTLSRLTILTP